MLAIGEVSLTPESRSGLPPSPLFKELDEVAVIEIGRRGKRRQIAAGSTVFGQGEIADSVYFVISGKVRLTMKDRNGRVWSFFDLANSGPGSLVGFSATVADRWASTATTTVDSVLLQIPRADWEAMLRAYPQLSLNLAEYVIDMLDKSQARFVQFSGAFTAQRVAMVLLSRAQLEGRPSGKRGWYDIPSPITHEDIASQVGTTRESVVTAMRKLEEILTRSGKLYSVDVEGLKQFIEQ